MADVLLLHHALGLTASVEWLADGLRLAGHTVTVPDVYDGHTFDDLDAGLGYARQVGFDTVTDRGVAAADGLPDALVYIGISLGVMAAQQLAQNRAGARGGIFISSFVPPEEFGSWPTGLPAQIHGMDADPIFADEGDLDAARNFVATTENTHLFVYPGDRHLLVEPRPPASDDTASLSVLDCTIEFLHELDRARQ